jgi:hypothetical protein
MSCFAKAKRRRSWVHPRVDHLVPSTGQWCRDSELHLAAGIVGAGIRCRDRKRIHVTSLSAPACAVSACGNNPGSGRTSQAGQPSTGPPHSRQIRASSSADRAVSGG